MVSFFKCALWAHTFMFVPTQDITAYDLAFICSKGACTHTPIAFDGHPQFEELPENIKRQFQPAEKVCVK